jgi:thiopurine S-methyltransferase
MFACGYLVVGAELIKIAINKLFEVLGIAPKISRLGELTCYRAKNIDIFVGNIFDVFAESLGLVDAVYDRAALVAIPANMRDQYTSHLMSITGAAPQLLITYEYNQQLMDGPPFSINEEELKRHYAGTYQVKPAESKKVAGGLKGKVTSNETVWLLKKINQ